MTHFVSAAKCQSYKFSKFPLNLRRPALFSFLSTSAYQRDDMTSGIDHPVVGESLPIDTIIKQDHDNIIKIYQQMKHYRDTENLKEANKWRNLLVYEVARHSVTEEVVWYPEIESVMGKELADHNRKEHLLIKERLSGIDSLPIADVALIPKVEDMLAVFKSHAHEEEQNELPKFRENVGDERMLSLGKSFALNKRVANTHPHTMSPDKGGMFERIAGLIAQPLDRLQDMMRSFPTEAEIAQVLGGREE
jgi:hypothetical protein